MDIPFNMQHEVSLEDLRKVPKDYNQMRQGIDFLCQKIDSEKDSKLKAKMLMLAGEYSRVVLDFNNSEKYLEEALNLFKEIRATPEAVATKLRLAVTYQWMEKFGTADEIFYDLLKKLPASKDPKVRESLEFLHQHYGESKFEQRQYSVALEHFLKALDLRLEKGDTELIQCTQVAIGEASRRIPGNS